MYFRPEFGINNKQGLLGQERLQPRHEKKHLQVLLNEVEDLQYSAIASAFWIQVKRGNLLLSV